MCVDISHFVPEALCDANDQVVDEGSDGSQRRNILSGPMMEFDVDNILLGMRKVDCQVAEILGELACSPVRTAVPCALPN